MTVRAYVPSTPTLLERALHGGVLAREGTVAHAVTEAVRRALPGTGEEDWEYVASTAAAQDTVALLDDDEPARRVVLAVEVPTVRDAADAEDPTRVLLPEVPRRRLAAVLVDSDDAAEAVRAARDAVRSGSAQAELLLELCLDHELGWWAAQEAPHLLDDLRRPPPAATPR